VLYVESPGGVGFSTCEGEDCNFDDHRSAIDNLNALVYFFTTKFPEF